MELEKKIWVSGIVTEFQDTRQIVHPEIEFLDEGDKQDFWHSRTVLPVYALTEKVKINLLRTLVYNAFSLYHQHIEETQYYH